MSPVPKPKRKVDKALLDKVREMPCCVCGAPGPSDPSHIKTRGSGGDDVDFNVFPKCRSCHYEWHQGWWVFILRYPHFRELLSLAGWDVQCIPPRLTHPRFHELP